MSRGKKAPGWEKPGASASGSMCFLNQSQGARFGSLSSLYLHTAIILRSLAFRTSLSFSFAMVPVSVT